MSATPAKQNSANSPAAKSGTFQIAGDLPIYRLGYGAMRITGKGIWGEPKDRPEAIKVLRRAVALGINFIDTADSYGPGVSEEISPKLSTLIRRVSSSPPKRASIAPAPTNGSERRSPTSCAKPAKPASSACASNASVYSSFTASIPSFLPPISSARSKIFSSREKSNTSASAKYATTQIADSRKIVPIVTVQNKYSVVDRAAEDVLDYCQRENIGFIPWFPLAAGDISAAGNKLEKIAARLNVSPSQLALAWLLQRSKAMLPIPGTSRVAHLEENVAAAAITLDAQTVQELDNLSPK